jgi:hypothetical protein
MKFQRLDVRSCFHLRQEFTNGRIVRLYGLGIYLVAEEVVCEGSPQ